MAAVLADVLQELRVSNGLEMAAVVSADGLIIDATASDGVDTESIGSVASNGLLMMVALGEELGEDVPQMMTIEFGQHLVILSPVNDDHLLILLAGTDVNLGRLRIIVRRRMDSLAEALSGI